MGLIILLDLFIKALTKSVSDVYFEFTILDNNYSFILLGWPLLIV